MRPLPAMLVRAALPVGILVVGGVVFWVLSQGPENPEPPVGAPQAIRTRVTELRVQDYPVVITTHGVVQPHNAATLSAQVSGQIVGVGPSFETGAFIAEGEVLVELDVRDYQIALAVAEARQLGAGSALQLAKLNHERNLELARDKLISDTVADQSAATLAQATAELDSARAQVDRARQDLDRTRIRAPFEGRVREKYVGLGQFVGPGTPLGSVFAVDFAEVRLPLDARARAFLSLPGELSNLLEIPPVLDYRSSGYSLDSAPEAPLEVELRDAINPASAMVWKGRIVRTEGVLDADSLDLWAIARIHDPFGIESGQPPLWMGQPVTASIAGKTLTNVVALPRGAVRQLDQVVLVQRTNETNLTLMPRTIVPVWSDAEHIVVRDPVIGDGTLLATTHLVYAPSGAQAEIIPEIPPDTAVSEAHAPSFPAGAGTNSAAKLKSANTRVDKKRS